MAGLLYTDVLARAFAWQWLEVSEDAKSARGRGGGVLRPAWAASEAELRPLNLALGSP